MLPDVQSLMDLQQADKEILRLRDEIAALPKRVAVIEAKLAGTKAELENAKTAVKADEASKRKYESAIQDEQGKISKYRDQSLAVKNNEQYKALLTEIEFAQQDIRANEDKILDLMVNAEAREKAVKAAELDLKAEMADIEKEKNQARERTAEDEKLLAEWNAKRDQARAGVSESLLRHFDRVSKFRGSGLAEVHAHKCMGCQVMLRPQTYNEVRGGNMVICESCQRILYFNPSDEVELEAANNAQQRKRARPKADAPQAWFFRPDYPEHGEVLLGFTNEGGNSSRRIYDFNTGRQIGDILSREGNYKLGFPEDMTEETVRLNGHWDEEEMEEWGTEMPMTALDALHTDLQLARSDHAKHHAAKQEQAVTSEHPAAS